MAASALGAVALWSQQRGAELLPQVARSPARIVGCDDAEVDPANADGFVGLINQGATCYLSSLLQVPALTPAPALTPHPHPHPTPQPPAPAPNPSP